MYSTHGREYFVRFVTAKTAGWVACDRQKTIGTPLADCSCLLAATTSSTARMSSGVIATAVYSYTADESDELTIEKGDSLVLLETYDDGWWLMRKGTVTGLVPSNYMTIAEDLAEPPAEPTHETKSQKQRNRSGERGHNRKEHRKEHQSAEFIQLKTLREEAEEKINALR
jgi:uncharacterized protein YaiE (UPF0345 family)